MELILPKLGLFFWTLVVFLSVFLILRKFAWKAILNAIHEREKSIEEALKAADKAREEMKNLTAENDRLLARARDEREAMLKEARGMREQIVATAKEEAARQAADMVEKARQQIQAEKMAAITELKNQVAVMSIQVAEKVLRDKLNDREAQSKVLQSALADLRLN